MFFAKNWQQTPYKNVDRAIEFCAWKLNFNTVKKELVNAGIITPELCIEYTLYIHKDKDQRVANNFVMRAVARQFFISHEVTALVIKTLESSGRYSKEAFHLSEFFEIQKANDCAYFSSLKKAYYFPDYYNKPEEYEEEMETSFLGHDEEENMARQNLSISAVDPQSNQESMQDVLPKDTFCLQGAQQGAVGNKEIITVQGETYNTETVTAVDDVDILTESMGQQATITPPDQKDDKVAAVFHKVFDYQNASDISNVDEINVLKIVRSIGEKDDKLKGLITTKRIGKARKRYTRPLKVTFPNESTRNSILELAKKNPAYKILPYKPKPFWKKITGAK